MRLSFASGHVRGISVALFSVSLLLGDRSSSFVPVVLWHGMGDSCCNPESLGKIIKEIEKSLPGIYVLSINLAGPDGDVGADRKASFFGNANDQVEAVCQELAEDKYLADGFNAIGFSQGGQFLRAYVERCNYPRVNHLITFGAQHAGVSDIPNCGPGSGIWCGAMRRIVGSSAYSTWAQSNVIQAQYFKDPRRLEQYYAQNQFLTDINNELEEKNVEYADRMASVASLVMIKFAEDKMIIPKETAWFGSFENGTLLSLRKTRLFKEDWIGLRKLDEKGGLVFKTCPGPHMSIPMDFFRQEVIVPYLTGLTVEPTQEASSHSPRRQSLLV